MAADKHASTSTSRSLIARVKEDDRQAWDRLVDLYAPLVMHWCRRWNLQEQDRSDIFQEVFRRVAASIHGFRKEAPSDTFRGWLRTLTRNQVHDHFRRLARQPPAVGGSSAHHQMAQIAAPEEKPENSEAEASAEFELLERALQLIRCEFEDRTWQAFRGTAIDDRPTSEVAAELSMSPGAVRVAKSRVLKRLRLELGDHPD